MKRIIRIAAIVVALLVAVALALPFLIDANTFRPALESRLSAALGRQVTLGGLNLSILSGGVSASDVTVSEDPAFGTQTFLRAKALEAGVDLGALIFSRRLRVRSFTVAEPEISLLQDPQGTWNFSSLGSSTAAPQVAAATTAPPAPEDTPLDLSVQLIRISGGRLTVAGTAPGSAPRSFEDVNIEVRDFSPDARFPFSLDAQVVGGGEVTLEGEAGPIATAQAAQTPFEARLILARLNLLDSGFTSATSGAAGLLSLDATTVSDGAQMKVNGGASLRDWKLSRKGLPSSEPIEADFALQYNRANQRGIIEQIPVRIGAAEFKLAGSYNLAGESPVIDATVLGENVPLTALTPVLPALDIVLPAGATIEQGALTVNLASKGRFDNLVTTGSIEVTNATLANFSLSDKLKALQQLSGIKAEPKSTIEQLASAFQVTPQGTTVSNVRLAVPSVGEIAGSGAISPDHALDFRAQATVRAQTVLAALGRQGEAFTLPLLIQGTSSNPSFKVDLKGAAAGKLDQITRDPSSAIDAAKGILDLFKRAPQQEKK